VPPSSGDAKQLIDLLASAPRGAGGSGERDARKACAAFLEGCGLQATEEPFSYSNFPGRWGTPLAGLILLCAFPGIALFASRGALVVSLGIAVAAILNLTAIWVLSQGRFLLHLPFGRSSGVNLVATTRLSDPRIWLVAHLDSKSQPISILTRALSVSAVVGTYGAALLLLALQWGGLSIESALWFCVGVVGAVSALPLLLSVVSDRSNGALDNASGVAAVLLAARTLSRRNTEGFGVLLTSAEELGLAGAHAFAAARQAGTGINCDSIDESGGFIVLTGRSGGGRAHQELAGAFARNETPVRSARMLSGILVDALAFQARGWDMVTVCKGGVNSLARIHAASDRSEFLFGDATERCALLLADATQALLDH